MELTSKRNNSNQQDSNNYWEQLERLEKLIRAAELKAGIIFSFHTIIFGLFIDKIGYFEGIIKESTVFVILTGLWILTVLLSILYCFKCFLPHIVTKYPKNVFFFRDAAYSFGNIKEYSKKLMEVCSNNEELFTQLSEQINIESKIISRKFENIHKSIQFFVLSVIFIIIIIFFCLIRP